MFTARQVALQEYGSRHAVDGPLALLPADIGGDEQIFRRFGRQSLIPEDQRNRQSLLQVHGKTPHGLDRRTFPPVQLQRESQHDLSHLVGLHERRDVRHIAVKCAAFEGLERLRGPAQLIAEGNADPLGPVI